MKQRGDEQDWYFGRGESREIGKRGVRRLTRLVIRERKREERRKGEEWNEREEMNGKER